MKRGLVYSIFALGVLLFQMVCVTSISSDIAETYRPGETIISQLYGNILWPISPTQIELKRGNQNIAFQYDIKKLENNYYLWLIAPQNEENYTLVISDIVTSESGVVKEVDYEKTFSVRGNLTDYSIRPGVILATQNFEIAVTLNKDQPEVISVSFPSARSVTLQPGENKIYFSMSDVAGNQFVQITVGQYSVPSFLVGQEESECPPAWNCTIWSNCTDDEQMRTCTDLNSCNASIGKPNETRVCSLTDNIPDNPEEVINNAVPCCFDFSPKLIESKLLVSEHEKNYYFRIVNTGLNNVSNLMFDFNRSLFSISPDISRISIEANGSAGFNLSAKNLNGSRVREVVEVSYENFSKYLLIKIDFTQNKTETSTNYYTTENDMQGRSSCTSIGGLLCIPGENCTGATIESIEGECCVGGSCATPEESGGMAWIGYLIIGIVAAVLVVLFLKYRKTKAEKNPLQRRVYEVEKNNPMLKPRPPATSPKESLP